MEIGEYARDEEGEIYKVTEIFLRDANVNIKKHSKSIIDLIEVGDIVNGQKVMTVCYGKKEGVEHTINFELDNGQAYSWKEKYGEEMCDFQLIIETILTHEQYEQNCYKLKEIN